jgi:hypothetical protein
VIAACLLFAGSRGCILFKLQPVGSDTDLYFEYASRAVDLGETPYAGALQIEYPPAAWWVISGARHLSGGPLLDPRDQSQIDASHQRYTRIFRWLMCACDVAAFLLFAAIVRRRRPAALGLTLLTYTLATATLGHLLYDRLDAGVLMLLLAWGYCWIRADADEPGRPLAWTIGAYGAIGLGIAYKLVPILALPFLLLAELLPARRRRWPVVAMTLAVTVALPFVLQYHASGSGTFFFLTYQAGRGIEVESIYATLMEVASLFGPPIAVSLSHGATDLSGTLAPAMKTAATLAEAGLVGGLALWALMRPRRYTPAQAYRLACLTMAAAVLLSNVLSPQYFLWALPMVLLLATDVLGDDARAHLVSAGAVVALAAMTTWVFPYHFYYFGDSTPLALVPMSGDRSLPPSPLPFIVLALRNGTYLALVVWLGRRCLAAAPRR